MTPSGPITKEERDRALDCLKETEEDFLAAINGLSEAQWKFKPAPDRWSIEECAEHVAVSEEMFWKLVCEKMKSPATPGRTAEVQGKDEILWTRGADRSFDLPAPECVCPTGRFETEGDLAKVFVATRREESAFLSTTQGDLRYHFVEHPGLGTLDAYQWLVFNGVHCKRHIAQILEVKADPNYPKS